MQDSQASGSQPPSRRGFFLGAATVGVAAAAVTALPKVAPSPDASAASPEPKPAPEKGGGYSLSEHVKRYYKTASA
ncbi:MAG: formate dehydrogenase [Variovorax sp.]|nr:formate dehydrogenase [Variovorax sp.]